MPEERVLRADLPPHLEEIEERLSRRLIVEPGRVESGDRVSGRMLEYRLEQHLTGGEVGVHGLPRHSGGLRDILDARRGIAVQDGDRRAVDRRPVLLGVRALAPAPSLSGESCHVRTYL